MSDRIEVPPDPGKCDICGVPFASVDNGWSWTITLPDPRGGTRRGKCCSRCSRRADERRWWTENYGDIPLVVAKCAELGVGERFFRDGNPPSLKDAGLVEHIASHPLPKGGLFLAGPVGSHKTHLLAARTVDASKRGWKARLVSWTSFVLRVRQTYQSGSKQSEGDVLKELADCDYLAIDDLGVGREASAESEANLRYGFELFDRRYARGDACTTDVASNLTLDEIETRFDARIGRRLGEMCSTYPMLVDEGQA